eukprot:Amastigsp_a2395_132.p4 type:complete len:100 gc:universal Amastigsp_a2395_132:360-61(-)
MASRRRQRFLMQLLFGFRYHASPSRLARNSLTPRRARRNLQRPGSLSGQLRLAEASCNLSPVVPKAGPRDAECPSPSTSRATSVLGCRGSSGLALIRVL